MRCIIPQITWNSCQQLLSLDFDPSCKGEHGFYRLVTVGADTNLLVWHLSEADTLKPSLKCITELNRHQKAVNTVRFSPDGNWIASGDDDAYIIIWRNDRKSPEEENWSVEKSLRKHLGDVTDLSWSLDSNFLLSSSVDSTAVCWDVTKGSSKYLWTEHGGFVQGVSFDPIGEFAATISIDRTLRLFDVKTGKLKAKVSKYQGWVDDKSEEYDDVPSSTPPVDNVNQTENGDGGIPTKKIITLGNHIFQDDDLATFCRRLSFSPRGEFLIVPAGSIPSERKILVNRSQQDSPCDSAAKKIKLKPTEKPATDSNNAVIIFCRNDFSVPCAIIPTGTSYSIACRFCPVYFQQDNRDFVYGEDISNPVKKDQRRIYCTGKLKHKIDETEDALLESPYRMVYAVCTNNSVMIGATDRIEPLAIVRNIHFTRLTDLTWSPDGRTLVTCSTDGYCSLITFDENELGVPLTGEIPQLPPSSFPVPVKAAKVKAQQPKQKVGTSKKEKTPGTKGEKTPGTKREKTKGTKKDGTPSSIKSLSEKTKTGKSPKSALSTPESGKRKAKTPKPTKLRSEFLGSADKTPKANTDLPTSSNAAPPKPYTSTNLGELPNPYVHLVRITEDNPSIIGKSLHKSSPSKEVDVLEEDKSPAPIKFMPQKNTLDRWIIKKKQNEIPNTTPVKPSSHSKNSTKSLPVRRIAADKSISSASTPTVAATQDDDDEECMIIDEVESRDKSKPAAAAGSDTVSQTSTLTPTLAVAQSESPKQIQKQPRRIAFITLSSAASIPKSFSEGPKEPTEPDSKSN